MPLKSGKLTPQERKFSEVYAGTGHATFAAWRAGYRNPETQAHQVLARPAVQADSKRRQMARLNNDLLPIALDFLEFVLLDDKETTKNRLDATKQITRLSFGQPGDAGDDKEPHELAPNELQARIDKLRRIQAEMASPLIEGEAVEAAEVVKDRGVFD